MSLSYRNFYIAACLTAISLTLLLPNTQPKQSFFVQVSTDQNKVNLRKIRHMSYIERIDGDQEALNSWYRENIEDPLVYIEFEKPLIALNDLKSLSLKKDWRLEIYSLDISPCKTDTISTQKEPLIVRCGLVPGTNRVQAIVVPLSSSIEHIVRLLVRDRYEWMQAEV